MGNRYRKKPLEVEAVQWSGSNWHEVYAFAGHQVYTQAEDIKGETIVVLHVKTLDAEGRIPPGDWLMKGIKGEFYPCRDDIFTATYDEIKDEQEEG